MPVLLWVVVFTALGGVASVLLSAQFLLLPARARERWIPALVAFAAGSLLAGALLALLPHVLETHALAPDAVMATLLAGILVFYLLERGLMYRHGCADGATTTSRATGYLILVGDGIHNFVDGVLIGSSFLTDVRLGIVTSLAVAAHEIPHELGDFAVLLASGFSRARALAYSVAVGFLTVAGGVLAYFALRPVQFVVPYALVLAAASFLYIALADLMPVLLRRAREDRALSQLAALAAGVALIYAAEHWLHR